MATATPIPRTGEAEIGKSYRATFICRGPYWPELDKRLLAALNGSERFQNWLDFTAVTSFPPSRNEANGKNNPYVVQIEFDKVGPGSPIFVLLAAIGLVIVATAGFVIISANMEEMSKGVTKIFSPQMLVAIVVLGGLYLSRKAG